MSRHLLPPLVALAVALAGLIGWEVMTAPTAGPASPTPGPAARTAAAAPPWGVTPEEVAALLSRPPLSPSRRPDPVDGATLVGLPVLSGILVGPSDRRAIFAGAGGGKAAVVQVGNQIGVYRVEAISPANVTLTGPDGVRSVAPAFSSAPPPQRPLPNGFAAGAPALPPPPPPPLAGRQPLTFRPAVLVGLLALASCADTDRPPFLDPLPPVSGAAGQAGQRVNGRLEAAAQPDAATQVSLAPSPNIFVRPPSQGGTGGGGDISLNFADTDIREVVAQVLGNMLGANYTIDPAVRGTATLRTTTPISRSELLPTLQALLAQDGAALVQSGNLYRVVPAAAGAGGLAAGVGVGGTTVLPLRFANAEELAKTLTPYVQNGGRITADASRNAIIVSGDPSTLQTLTALVGAFDVDVLAGQSYALFPVGNGDAKDFAGSLQDAIRGQGAGLNGAVRVVPMARINAVLVVASQPQYIDDVRRVLRLVMRSRGSAVRSWHVYYLQNSRSNDTAYVLQQAFTPNSVTAQPTPQTNGSRGTASQQIASRGALPATGAIGGIGAGGLNAGGGGAAIGGGIGGGPASSAQSGAALSPTALSPAAAPSANPLLGGLDPAEGSNAAAPPPNSMRIIPNVQTNALLIYATEAENSTVEGMLRKLDILPLQVRIDATIAEVTLNDELQYGTQFFFRSGLQGALSFGATAAQFASGFPGFVLSGANNTSAALNALQAVTKVRVLSSPQLLVVDNEPARLQVGALVPYLSQTAQSTVASEAPIVSSINYQQTGVIMQVTPRVNSGGLVTLDITQEVSDVDPNVTTPGVNSPTFNERSITSRVVIQDGQTVGLAGLIRDSDSRDNRGIPWLKDIPLLGFLAGRQTNIRGRTELLVLITPHVVHDQRDARALTQDLRDELVGAAAVRQQLQALPASGSADPNAPLRRALNLH